MAGKISLICKETATGEGSSKQLDNILGTPEETQRLCRNFLWNGQDGTTSHALIGYDDMCAPCTEGGLGIREPWTANRTAMMRNIWLMVSKKNTL